MDIFRARITADQNPTAICTTDRDHAGKIFAHSQEVRSWPIPSGSEVHSAMLPNVGLPGAMRPLKDPMTAAQLSADLAVAPRRPT